MTDQAKRFPIQGGLTVSWVAAERAYRRYAELFGTDQSLERLAERGGFGLFEFAVLHEGGNPVKYDNRKPLDERHLAVVLHDADVRPK